MLTEQLKNNEAMHMLRSENHIKCHQYRFTLHFIQFHV